MTAVNGHRKGVSFMGTVSNNDLEEGDSDFTTHCDNSFEGDNASIIRNLEFLKQTVSIDANKNCTDSDDCRE